MELGALLFFSSWKYFRMDHCELPRGDMVHKASFGVSSAQCKRDIR